jgi:hypothetical protein
MSLRINLCSRSFCSRLIFASSTSSTPSGTTSSASSSTSPSSSAGYDRLLFLGLNNRHCSNQSGAEMHWFQEISWMQLSTS